MNMKKILCTVAVVLAGALAADCLAGETADAVDDSMRQLGRGISNIAVGVIEIPESVLEVQEQDGEVAAITYGTLRGIWRFGVREVVGVFEVVTFPVRFKPIVRPEFPARNGVINTVFEANKLPDEGEIQDWEVDGLRLNR
jgi:putative exosortase-associated protein (TIGR04073 family)